MKTAILKYNGSKLALLCSTCRVVVKEGKDFNIRELQFARGEIKYLPPLYCSKHLKNEN